MSHNSGRLIIALVVLGVVAVRLGLSMVARVRPAVPRERELPTPRILELPPPRPRATGAWWRVLLIGLYLAVIGAYLTVSFLHGLWDGLPGLLDGFLAPGADVLAALGVVSATGLFLLWWRWREAVRLQSVAVDVD